MLASLEKIKEVVGIAEPHNEKKEEKKAEEAKKTAEDKEAAAKKATETSDSKSERPFEVVKGKAVKKEETENASQAEDAEDTAVIEQVAATEEAEVVKRQTQTKEEKNMATEMRSMDFYSKAGNAIYDVDRGLEMDSQLRGWIIEQFSKDQELKKEVLRTLPGIIEKNPKIIPSIKEMIRDAAEAHVPYIVTYLSKIDDKEYEDRGEAEAAGAEMAKRLGLEVSKTIRLVYHRLKEDGSIGPKVSRNEVEDFVSNFDGDRDKLRKELHLSNPSKKKGKTESVDDKPAAAATSEE